MSLSCERLQSWALFPWSTRRINSFYQKIWKTRGLLNVDQAKQKLVDFWRTATWGYWPNITTVKGCCKLRSNPLEFRTRLERQSTVLNQDSYNWIVQWSALVLSIEILLCNCSFVSKTYHIYVISCIGCDCELVLQDPMAK